MANNQSSASIMSASMNMAITIFGFVLSALFIMVICCRLLCSRFRQANTLEMLQSGRRSIGSSSIERSLQGLEPSVVACFPTIKFNQQIFSSSEDNLCTICLGEYKEKEVLRILPRCGHAFHVSCIDAWLRQHSTCPVCRISLRVFSEWRQMSGPLISISAKPRFVPGALPDSMFEQPTDLQNVPVGTPTNLPKESVGWPVEVKGEGDPEMAESSSSRHHETAGLIEDESMKESLSMQAHSVPNNQVTLVRQPNSAADDSKRTLLCDGYVIDVPSAEQEESALCLHDDVVVGWDRGPSVGCTTLNGGRTAAS